MWIKYICLENFKNINTGLKAKRIEIDFSKRENTICLITGPNGMGKTSLLSCLTPFATLGNLDIRENNQLIMDHVPGYKKIIIINGPDTIDIEHFYSVNKDSHSVKSYFKLNGNELNPNGNVTSFKSIVSDVLHIDMDYLKLIRLGDNVTNLIRLKGTERKNFMSKMLPSVDNYLKHYKKVSADVRDLKVVMSHIIDKMNKLNIEDKEKQKQRIEELKDGISYYEKEIEKTLENIHKISFEINSLNLPEDYKEELRKLKKKESRYRLALEDENAKIENIERFRKELKEKEEQLQYHYVSDEFLTKEIERLMKEQDTLEQELMVKIRDLDVEIKNANLNSLEEYLMSLLKKDKEDPFEGLPFIIQFKPEELDEFVINLKNIQRELNVTYEFGREPIRDVMKLMDDKINVGDFVTARLLSIENKKERSNKTYLDTLIDKYEKVKISCEVSCPYKDLFHDVMNVKDLKPVKDVPKSAEYYQIMNIVHDNIVAIIEEFKQNQSFIQKLPDEYQAMFLKKRVFKRICDCECIYDEKKINELMSIIGEYNNYLKRQKEIEEVRQTIDDIKKNSKIPYLKKEITTIKEKNEKVKEEREEKISLSEDNRETEIKLKEDIESLETTISAVESYGEIFQLMKEMEEKVQKKEILSTKKEKEEKLRESLEQKKAFLMSETNRSENNYQEYLSLEKELKSCKEMYDDYVILQSALSTKEGVPLLHIKMYLKDTKEIANDLLAIAYHEDDIIQLDDFEITGDSFKIPYIKNGITIPDISYASQGEQSFLNMAISFALSIQNLTEYNIPLLDEVDATFDQLKREKAIAVIEKQNEIIQCEQAFVISHNNMYDQYPVDLIDFSDLTNSIFDIKLS